ncbi:hypothetical protein SAMN05421637_1983 [Demequina mangrovi]|uniref:Uncharacterized protein n=1 Tax=Demequina mangrovi TaxID=1043493 RepID=A0A1H6ZJ73_9MICO|nr:hypothetical protein SAMN05421637_1983 [Demequina mangrovi]
MDVVARIDFLRHVDAVGEAAASTCSLSQLAPHDQQAMGLNFAVLADLDARSRALGRLPADQVLKVSDHGGPHGALAGPSNEAPVGSIAPRRYELSAGADAVAVMIRLGVTHARFGVDPAVTAAIDYTAWLRRLGIVLDGEALTGWGPWPNATTSDLHAVLSDPAEAASDPAVSELRALVAEKSAQLARYEERIDRIYDAVGVAPGTPATEMPSRARLKAEPQGNRDGRIARGGAHAADAVSGLDAPAPVRRAPAPEQGRAARIRAFARSGALARLERLRATHQGERCVIIADGVGLTDADLDALSSETTFATDHFVPQSELVGMAPTYICTSTPSAVGRAAKRGATVFAPFLAQGDHTGDPHCVTRVLLAQRSVRIDAQGSVNLNVAEPLRHGHTDAVTMALPLARFMGFSEVVLIGCEADGEILGSVHESPGSALSLMVTALERDGIRTIVGHAGEGLRSMRPRQRGSVASR